MMTPEQTLAAFQERGERTCRDGPVTLLRKRDAQDPVDSWSCQDSDDGERRCAAEQANSVQWS